MAVPHRSSCSRARARQVSKKARHVTSSLQSQSTAGERASNTGDTTLRFLELFRAPRFMDVSLKQWMALTPHELVQAHLDIDRGLLDALPKEKQAADHLTFSPSPRRRPNSVAKGGRDAGVCAPAHPFRLRRAAGGGSW
jgi:hypothetical protein